MISESYEKEKYSLPKASEEQQIIVNHIKHKKNVVVDSVAGSGKTTTILHIAHNMKKYSILLLTYNAKLKLDTRNKVKLLNIENLEVNSYHSFGVKYYCDECHIDSGIITIVNGNIKPRKPYRYDLIILDELQDMTPLYYCFVSKILCDNAESDVQLCALGDKFQSIYDFNKADNRFIIHTNKFFPQLTNDWIISKLSYSFRTTHQIAEFVNKCALGQDRIKATKHGNKLRYILCNTFKPYTLYKELEMYLKTYNYEDIFVLAPSVRSSKSPIRLLANMASKHNIDIYVPNNDDVKIDEEVIKRKVVFSTFHQVKGLERKVVLIFGFDDSYFTYYKKKSDPSICPNEIYVALTRAIECISVFHNHRNNFLQFLKLSEVKIHSVFIEKDKLSVKQNTSSKSPTIAITEITRHLPSEIINACIKLLKFKKIKEKDDLTIDIPTKVSQENGKYEMVSEITSVAVPAYYQYLTTKKLTIADRLIEPDKSSKKKFSYSDINLSNPKKLLELSNKYCSKISGYNYKLRQITNYTWLTKENLTACIDRLKIHIGNDASYEVPVFFFNDKYDKILSGNINCKNGAVLWNFKCVEKISDEIFIQNALLAYCNEALVKNTYDKEFHKLINEKYKLLKTSKKNDIFAKKYIYTKTLEDIDTKLEMINRKYRLMNILTHEIYELEYDLSNIELMVHIILRAKFGENKKVSDDNKFIKEMLKLSKRYNNTIEI
jgi:hypothetical protein